MPPGFHLLIAAQFVSALADNALLIVTIALLHAQGQPLWWAPLLKFSFTIAYVVLAPLVGPLADAVPKARLMALMNGVKVIGVVALIAGLNPLLCFAVVGLGAAAYAPAKYGLVTEMVAPARLVAANAWLEVSIVCAVLLGTMLGGLLVSDLVPTLAAAFAALLGLYALAALLNIGIPASGVVYPPQRRGLPALFSDFRQANATLWRDRIGGLSLAITTVFWGAGATLLFAVLRWAQDVVGLSLEHAAYLQAVVAVGVVAGAALAGRLVALPRARRVLPAGVALGLLVPVIAGATSVPLAVPWLAAVGLVGGVLVVPMNALLQHRGHRLLSAGRSIAVQGINENLSVLAMLAVYAALLRAGLGIQPLMALFGVSIAVLVALLMLRPRWRQAVSAAAARGPA